MPRSQRPKGYVIWEGPSPLDNKPLVAIAIMQSTNTKTGNMVQVYICLLYTSPSPRDRLLSRMPSSA